MWTEPVRHQRASAGVSVGLAGRTRRSAGGSGRLRPRPIENAATAGRIKRRWPARGAGLGARPRPRTGGPRPGLVSKVTKAALARGVKPHLHRPPPSWTPVSLTASRRQVFFFFLSKGGTWKRFIFAAPTYFRWRILQLMLYPNIYVDNKIRFFVSLASISCSWPALQINLSASSYK